MHDCSRVSVHLVCSSRPIIEDCEVIQFAPLPALSSSSSSLVGLFSAAIDTTTPTATTENEVIQQQQQPPTNLWNQVDDFKWLKPEPSPNWYAIDHQELDLAHRDRLKQIEAKIGSLKQIRNEDEFATGIEKVLRIADFRESISAEPDKESWPLENHH